MDKKILSERDPAELELATMRQCLKLIRRLPADGRERAVAYLASAAIPVVKKLLEERRQDTLPFES